MVRFQSLRSFASTGENAAIDYLVTNKAESGTELIAAAVAPSHIKEIEEACEAATLSVDRITLRPLSAASLYLENGPSAKSSGETVMIDLLAQDAEIVVARDGKVVFVRTVRMPQNDDARPKALLGELRRSLMACGADRSPNEIVLWGRSQIHANEVKQIDESIGVKTIGPRSI